MVTELGIGLERKSQGREEDVNKRHWEFQIFRGYQ